MAPTGYGTYGGRSFGAEGASRHVHRPGSFAHDPRGSVLGSGGPLVDVEDARATRLRNRIKVWELILVPWSVLLLVLITYLLGGAHGIPVVLWLVPLVLLVLSVAFVRWHYKAGNNAEVVLGLLCILAVLIGILVGTFAVINSLGEYYRVNRGASYFNVLPIEPAGGKSDATAITFTDFTYVDPNRTYGYVDARHAVVARKTEYYYCVAPVLSGLHNNSRIQYWAAGEDCCHHRNKFNCGDAMKKGAYGAVVMPKAMKYQTGFLQAVHGAESEYGLKSDDNYLLLRWSADPLASRDALWTNALTLFIIFASAYFVVSMMVGCALMPVIMTKDT